MSITTGEELDLLRIGEVFHGQFEVLGLIRKGGMGCIYEVLHQGTRRKRALKVMPPAIVSDPELRARFKLEACVAGDIESEHIVEIFDAGVDDATGMPFILMERLRGKDLESISMDRGALPAREVVALISQVTMVLERTHAAGILHRDLKPENLFLTQRDDGTPRLKVLDFGIAKVVAENTVASESTCGIGTPMYMPPEQIRGSADLGPAADLYALGHVAYTLLAGEPFFLEELEASNGIMTVLEHVLKGPKETACARAVRRRGVALPPSFDTWFARAIAKDPGDRFPSATEMLIALADALDVTLAQAMRVSLRISGAPDHRKPVPTPQAFASAAPWTAKSSRRWPWFAAASAAVIALLFFGVHRASSNRPEAIAPDTNRIHVAALVPDAPTSTPTALQSAQEEAAPAPPTSQSAPAPSAKPLGHARGSRAKPSKAPATSKTDALDVR